MDVKKTITNAINNWKFQEYHLEPNLNKYKSQIMYVKRVASNKNDLVDIKSKRGAITTGPQDIQAAAIYKPTMVDISTTQKAAKPLNHNLRSPRVNRPYCVRRQTDTPHTYSQYIKHITKTEGVRYGKKVLLNDQ